MRALVGRGESITFEEADEIFEKLKTSYLFDVYELAKQATDDDEEISNINVNLATKLGNLLGAHELRCILEDPDIYIANIPYAHEQDVRIEEI